jgi:hypothetical protein
MDVSLIEAVRERAADPARATDAADRMPPEVFPVALPEQIAEAESALGFELPPLLKELYLRVGNGGYGPGYGLLGVAEGASDENGETVVDLYFGLSQPDPEDPNWRWPSRLLPVANLGCAMYACLDCTTPDAPLVWFEPNAHSEDGPWDDCFIPLASSMEAWLRSWLAGEDLLASAWKATFGKENLDAGQGRQ